jgi:hypothetical protein
VFNRDARMRGRHKSIMARTDHPVNGMADPGRFD